MREQNRQGLSPRRARTGISFGIVLMLILGLLAACGSQPAANPPATAPTAAPAGEAQAPAPTTAAAAPAPTTAPAAEAPAGSPVTIRWLMFHDDIANDKNMQEEMKLFNSSQSEIKVELIGVPWNDFAPKLQAMVAAGTPPDLVALQNEADFVSKGFVLPLEDLMKRDNIDENRFLPGAIEPAYDGKVYGFRHDTAFWLLYYNKDLFDAAGVPYPPATGWTVDEFMDTACKLSKPDEQMWGMHNVNWLTGFLIQQAGLPYLEMVDGVPQYKVDDPKTMAMYQKIADFINKQNCQPTADQNTSLGNSDAFIAGRAAMQFNGNWAFGGMKENAKFNYAVAPLPGLKQPNVGMKIGIVKTSQNQEAAWKFLQWLTYEPQATRYRTERGMGQPALNDEESVKLFLSGPTAPEGLPDVMKVLSNPANSFKVLEVPGVAEANNILNPATDDVINGLSQAADTIPPAVKQANEVLAEEWKKSTGQ